MTKKLEEYTKDELIEIVKGLKRRKKFGLVWEEKPEEVVKLCETELPVLEEVTKRAITKVKEAPTNLIIEGDNYHSLSVLNYTHAGKIDVIYIDPPYNTGKGFIYNDKYVEEIDTYRHSKWLAFMARRLLLAKSLLPTSGLIFISIDDNEHARLKVLCDEIFGVDNFIANVAIHSNPRGRQSSQHIVETHEYVLVYGKTNQVNVRGSKLTDKQLKEYNKKDEGGRYREIGLRLRGGRATAELSPTLHFPLYYNPKTETLSTEKSGKDFVEMIPKFTDGTLGTWRWSKEKINKDMQLLLVRKVNGQDGPKYDVFQKDYLNNEKRRKIKSLWDETEINYDRAASELKKIFGKKVFDYAKPLFLLRKIITMSLPENGTILDFMAGSGTTGHAILQLNQEDGGNRRFILCTNNENGIAENVTYERIKKAISGYADEKAIPANVKYFKTGLVSKQKTDDQTRIELVARSTEMICLREDTFEKVIDTKMFRVFGSSDHYTAIVFEPEVIVLLKDALRKLKDDKPIHIYVFSLSNDTYESDFADLERQHELRPIPESILEVYRRIFKDRNDGIGAYDD